MVNCCLLFYFIGLFGFTNGFFKYPYPSLTYNRFQRRYSSELNTYRKTHQFSQRYIEQLLKRIDMIGNGTNKDNERHFSRYYETLAKKLNSKNVTEQNMHILGDYNNDCQDDINQSNSNNETLDDVPQIRIIINKSPNFLSGLGIAFNPIE
jgi:hypothetical protein